MLTRLIRVKGQDVAFEPSKLLWLIQRDFLRKCIIVWLNSYVFCFHFNVSLSWLTLLQLHAEGKSVKEMVDEALKHVPNEDGQSSFSILFNWNHFSGSSVTDCFLFVMFFSGNKNIDQVCSYFFCVVPVVVVIIISVSEVVHPWFRLTGSGIPWRLWVTTALPSAYHRLTKSFTCWK